MSSRLVVGCMTGTSLDGLDAALVEITGRGLSMTARMVAAVSRPFSFDLGSGAEVLRRLASGEPIAAEQITNASREISLWHADVVAGLLRGAGAARPDLICVHGQTVFHAPPGSWQLFNPWPMARAVGAPVVFDLRGADLAAGGQGAPITPLADWVLFRRAEPVVVVNLGGFCNITRLPAADTPDAIARIEAKDVCACNQLLDGVARAVFGTAYDEDGRGAAAGKVNAPAAEELAAELSRQSSDGRSLGTGDEAGTWIQRWRERLGADLARTTVEGVARTITAACEGVNTLLLAGGGVKNRTLVSRLTALHVGDVQTTAAAGVPIEYREAAAMAVLGALCQDRVAITLPQVTGVRAPAPVAGCWVLP